MPMNMKSQASFFILVMLLGFSQSIYLSVRKPVDITTRILTVNKGSSKPLVEGDILLPRKRNSMVCPNNICFWKKSLNGLVEVPFTLSKDFSFFDRNIIFNAMATFHSKTCIRFVPRIFQTDYLSIENKDGCYSSVSRAGGAQVVSLDRDSCVVNSIIQHELNHALGFYHEHTRSDRDLHIIINWQNVDPAMQNNFNKENTNNLNTPYDYSSVMHYGRKAFSSNGLDTITPIANSYVEIGERQDLSAIDILRINKLYNC